jgi:hypothetical protein
MNTPIPTPINNKYRPDLVRFVCTCPYFVVSHFLICKHLVQSFHPVDPIFFLQVADNGTESSKHEAAHGVDGPEDEGSPNVAAADEYSRHNAARTDFEEAGDRSDDELVDTGTGRGGWDIEWKTFKEEMQAHIQQIRDFCDGLDYQIQFLDRRFLKTLES